MSRRIVSLSIDFFFFSLYHHMVLIYFLFYLLFICKPEWKFKLFIELEAEIDQTQSNMGLFWLVMYSEMKSVHLYTLILRVNLCNLMLVSFFKLINRFRFFLKKREKRLLLKTVRWSLELVCICTQYKYNEGHPIYSPFTLTWIK